MHRLPGHRRQQEFHGLGQHDVSICLHRRHAHGSRRFQLAAIDRIDPRPQNFGDERGMIDAEAQYRRGVPVQAEYRSENIVEQVKQDEQRQVPHQFEKGHRDGGSDDELRHPQQGDDCAQTDGEHKGLQGKFDRRGQATGDLPPFESVVGESEQVFGHPVPLPVVAHGSSAAQRQSDQQVDQDQIQHDREYRRSRKYRKSAPWQSPRTRVRTHASAPESGPEISGNDRFPDSRKISRPAPTQ